jgi:hypothetical protein
MNAAAHCIKSAADQITKIVCSFWSYLPCGPSVALDKLRLDHADTLRSHRTLARPSRYGSLLVGGDAYFGLALIIAVMTPHEASTHDGATGHG